MKYKVGDKVKYDSGDWWFYGTVTAIIENSISPCYRLNVERMVKKNCKFSITQFEFELDADNEIESDKDKRKWENSEIEYLKKYYEVQNKEELPKVLIPESEQVLNIPEHIPEQTGEPKPDIKPKKDQESKQQKFETPQDSKEVTPKAERDNTWERNFELYQKGEKSNTIHTWMYQNRKQYKAGNLKEERFEKLMKINFPFEVQKKKKESNDNWEKQLKLWKKGERDSLQQWRQRSVKQYVEGKLGNDRIEKLKEAGILK